ncbi:NirD/YgiW/YdeI family stress tolerance protein [Shewanella gelidimarina]|uniref:YgiW/YdeI family stress tolerance OB fold protein n=1 Tax=Shewanella gelidimarina TaxID=56813 RepID=UPI002010A25E|nr:NirD/YgiW/YdeI family stress tolerance protein [Shewanella gelidimarina]MCL1060218.1 NirD/YgiW/YdeI family stress tolerance protein [Shewanella gelidimarina]
MKNIIALGLLLTSSTVFANPAPVQGGFIGPSTVSINTVSGALDAADDTAVVLTGYIVESLGNEEYRFSDKSGEVIVEIDNDEWGSLEVTPSTKITLHGEVDSEWKKTSIDVDGLQLAD